MQPEYMHPRRCSSIRFVDCRGHTTTFIVWHTNAVHGLLAYSDLALYSTPFGTPGRSQPTVQSIGGRRGGWSAAGGRHARTPWKCVCTNRDTGTCAAILAAARCSCSSSKVVRLFPARAAASAPSWQPPSRSNPRVSGSDGAACPTIEEGMLNGMPGVCGVCSTGVLDDTSAPW